jgi:hypothetical protein
LNLETLRSLWRTLQDVDEDADCGALIVTGSGDRAVGWDQVWRGHGMPLGSSAGPHGRGFLFQIG